VTIIGRGEQQLTREESDELADLEAIVDAGLEKFLEVGNAIAEIRDRRLYRATHSDFNAYIRDRFGISGSGGHLDQGPSRNQTRPVKLGGANADRWAVRGTTGRCLIAPSTEACSGSVIESVTTPGSKWVREMRRGGAMS
jgi:hypothetical protein